MPFTFCHPAAVIPFNLLPKKWISFSALIVGSIIPDFEYFLRLKKQSIYSHTLAGLFWFDLPLGIVILLIYYGVVHKPLINNMPLILKKRFSRYLDFDWVTSFKNKWFIVVLCLLVGAASHIVWDSLTSGTANSLYVTPLIKKLSSDSLNRAAFYYYFSIISSFIGMLVIVVAIYQLPKDKEAKASKSRVAYWLLAVLITILFILGRDFIGRNLVLLDYIVSTITAMMFSLLVVSYVFKQKVQTLT